MKFRFEVQGSAAEPYVVIIKRSGDNLTAVCDCPAGNMGQYCKHRFSLFEGSAKGVIGGDLDSVSGIPELVVGTDVAESIIEMKKIEAEATAIKKRLAAAKKAVARAMST